MRLFSYKMTHDTGFAPNPFPPTLTLATCKPQLRRTKEVGDWIAGFTSKALNGAAVGDELLVYLAQIAEKLSFAEYYEDPRFASKKPEITARGPLAKVGDNIYAPLTHFGSHALERFEQLPNPFHGDAEVEDDLSGRFVLVAGEFYYFGRDALRLPEEVRPAVPAGQAQYGILADPAQANRLITYLRERYMPGLTGLPHGWPKEELPPTWAKGACG